MLAHNASNLLDPVMGRCKRPYDIATGRRRGRGGILLFGLERASRRHEESKDSGYVGPDLKGLTMGRAVQRGNRTRENALVTPTLPPRG